MASARSSKMCITLRKSCAFTKGKIRLSRRLTIQNTLFFCVSKTWFERALRSQRVNQASSQERVRIAFRNGSRNVIRCIKLSELGCLTYSPPDETRSSMPSCFIKAELSIFLSFRVSMVSVASNNPWLWTVDPMGLLCMHRFEYDCFLIAYLFQRPISFLFISSFSQEWKSYIPEFQSIDGICSK